jgi:hypothetical protein
LQVGLNTLTEDDYHDAFKKWQAHGRGLLQGWWWPVGPKLVFDQMAGPVS